MQDRPTAVELLDALGGFMRDRAENARDRWERFQFQVAANSIGIIKRELELEDGFMRVEWEEAIRGLDSPVASPYAVSFYTLPRQWDFIQQVRQAMRIDVHCARNRHAARLMPPPAAILHRRQHSGAQDFQCGHRYAATNFTRMPGLKRNG